jgi:hypothetical protein
MPPGAGSEVGGRYAVGGSYECPNTKQMTIDFSRPVSDVRFEVMGARMVTASNGAAVSINPMLDSHGRASYFSMVILPGSDITSITISDPVDTAGVDDWPDGGWEIQVANGSCSCAAPTPTPRRSRPGCGMPTGFLRLSLPRAE